MQVRLGVARQEWHGEAGQARSDVGWLGTERPGRHD